MFDRWGRFVYRRRLLVLGLSLLVLAASGVLAAGGGELSNGSPGTGSLESFRASSLVKQELAPATATPAGGSFLLIFSSQTLQVSDSAFRSALESALEPLRSDPRVTGIDTPYTVPPQFAAAVTSKNGREALVTVHTRDAGTKAQKYYGELRSKVHSDVLGVQGTGQIPINLAFNQTLEKDLTRAEYVSLPVSLVLLLIVFAAVVAALLPLGVGVMAIVGGIGGTFLLSRYTDVSQYALNIVTLIGLGVAIDYSLFIVNRFREELAATHDREAALGRTMASAGRAITFSGITVAIGLSAMLFYQGTFLTSMGAAGAIVVAMAVFYALTFLPALLALVGTGVDRLTIPFISAAGHGFWRDLAAWVMRRPLVVMLPTLALLLVMAIPFTHLRLANGGVDALPAHIEARQGYDRLLSDFPGQDQNTFQVVVDYGSGAPDASAVAALGERIATVPGVLRVDPGGTGPHIAVLNAVSSLDGSSDGARAILKQIRAESVPRASVLVTGPTAIDVDIIDFIIGRTPAAVAFVVLVTYLVLFLLTGSVVLPLKAVVMNLLSVSGSFGALVFIFQDGHGASLLGFTPQSLDPSIPVILFSIVFGLSMDYEVLLVARIHEEYRRTGRNRESVAEGLEKSGRLITGAAAIMVAVFLSFGLAEVVLIKAIGIGLAIAVALDATVVRALLVPSVMRLLGRWNWWAPGPLARLAERLNLRERHVEEPAAA